MSEELGNQIQGMFKNIYEAVDLKYVRVFKRQMFKCGHDCLDDKNSIRQVDKCVDDCGRGLHKAMSFIQQEVNNFQGKIDRCLMDCQDEVRSEKDEQKAMRLFEGCAEKCVKKFVPQVPDVVKSLSVGLDKIKKEEKL